jgi:Tfp pilus assembly protein PilF
LYAGRLFNLLAATADLYFAIRRTPIARWGFVALALTPMTLALAASLSPDALTNALSFLLIAQILACALGTERRVSNRSLALVTVYGAAIGLAKQAYFLLPLLYLIIPVAKVGGRRRYLMGFVLVLGATFAAVGSWAFVVRAIYSPADLEYGMNPEQQIRLMRSHPLEFLAAIARTATYAPMYAEEYIGWLGLIDLRLPIPVYIAEIALLIAVFIGSYHSAARLTVRQTIVAVGVVLLVVLTVLVVIHITWDAVGSESIYIRGRYFIPVGPIVGIILYHLGALVPSVVRRLAPTLPAAVTLVVPALLVMTLWSVHGRYFADSPQAAAIRLGMEAETLMHTAGQEGRARVLFERVLQLDPENTPAHLDLGAMLLQTRPAEAAEHFRFVLSRDPDNLAALNNLGLALANQGQYAEAIGLFRKALAIKPDEGSSRENLDKVLRAQEAVADAPRQIARALEGRARQVLLEERYPGTPKAGLYLKANRGRVVNAAGERLFPRGELFWRSPPPSGEEIRLFDAAGTALKEGERVPFYACGADHAGPSRIFVFPAPVGTKALNDEDVSWFYQLPLTELTPEEREREQDYRLRSGLRFPLATLPD